MIEKTAHPEGFIILTQRLFRKSRSRISVTEHSRREIALNAVKEAVKMLEQEFGDNLVSVTAFGSFAKGRRFHKVDVLIVLKELGNGQGARQRIAQITAERVFIPTFSKSHVLCNVLIYTREELKEADEHPTLKLPLWHDIAKHGVVLWGEKVIE